jgi:acetyl-CoA carboxylase carboxyl transferase subunit beta
VSSGAETRLASAWERAALVVDPDSIEPWDEGIVSTDPLRFSDTKPYPERLAEARERTGLGEAVLTGRATLDGQPLAIVAGEFGFLGGSVGVATSERIARAFERAVEQRLPLVALPASGGSRMQEGTLAVVGMAKLAAAAGRLRAAGLPYVVCLTDPTTGGALASWGSLGSVTLALPGALLGFAGPRVVELMTGTALPEGIQRAETLLAHGLIDDVVAPGELRAAVARVLDVAAPRSAPASASSGRASEVIEGEEERDAWRSLQAARRLDRPGASEILASLALDVTELRGDRAGHPDDAACVATLARICGWPAVVVGQRRDSEGTPGAMNAAGYRKARRAMALAAELDLPLVTIVDTPGAELSVEAEQGGLAGEIAGCLADMAALPVPTLALLIGEGGSGGALALLAADRVVVTEHGSLGVIAPEGASAILYHDLDHAPELAASQGGASWDLLAVGIADVGVPEPRPGEFLDALGAVVSVELSALAARDPAERLAARQARWRGIG